MRNRIILSVVALTGLLAFSWIVFAQGNGQPQARPANQFGGGADHTGAVPSVPPPEGWKACPRCQNQKDRTDATAKYKVEGHPFNAHDISGVWGFNGLGNFGEAPPLTAWGKQQHDATMGEKNEY